MGRIHVLSGNVKAIRTLLLIVFLGPAFLCFAQITPNSRDAGASDTNCLNLSIPVAVQRSPGLVALRLDDIHVTVDGNPAAVRSFRRVNGPQRFVLLLDRSSSMQEFSGSGLANGIVGAEVVLAALPEHSEVALVTFADTATIFPFEDREAVDRKVVALKNVKPEGKTALYAAIQQSLQAFGTPQPGDTVVIVSDGGNTQPPFGRKALENELLERGVRAFALLTHLPGIPQTPEERQGPGEVAELTRLTGGNTWVTSHIDHSGNGDSSAAALIRTFSEQLQPPYLLDFDVAKPITRSAKLKISTGAKGLELAYPQMLTACVATSATAHD